MIFQTKKIVDELINIMVDTLCSNKKFLKVSGEEIPLETIKYKFLDINHFGMVFILECLDNNLSNIKNIKSYLISVLLNAKSTINNYYKNKVNYDIYQNLSLKGVIF